MFYQIHPHPTQLMCVVTLYFVIIQNSSCDRCNLKLCIYLRQLLALMAFMQVVQQSLVKWHTFSLAILGISQWCGYRNTKYVSMWNETWESLK